MKPRGVYVKAGRYYVVRHKRWIALTKVVEGERAMLAALSLVSLDRTPQTITDLLRSFLACGMSDLRPTTQKQYARAVAAVLMPTFGHQRIGSLTASDVARFLEVRKEVGRASSGNRERAVLSAAYEFGLRRGYCQANPCRGVARNKERPRRRYVKDVELREAIDKAPVAFAELLSVAFLTGIRQGDLIALRRENLTADGIEFTESKGGRQRLIEWSPILRGVIEDAMERADRLAAKAKRPTPANVFTNRFGQPWTVWAIQSQRRRLGHAFHFHDIRGKAASDSQHNVLGRHSSLPVYLKRERSKPVR